MAQLEVPVAVPLTPLSVVQVTWVTLTSSDAVPPRSMLLADEEKFPLEVGDVIAITGGVKSGV